MPDVHAPWGASSSARLLACPGSYEASKGIEREESEWAAEGTAAHDVCEQLLVVGKTKCTDDEMLRCAQEYVALIKEWSKVYVVLEEHTERFLMSETLKDVGGTSDHCIIGVDRSTGETVCHVFDFKYGVGIAVNAAENKQLLTYAMLAEGNADDYGIKQFRLTICQPRGHGETVSTWETDIKTVCDHFNAISSSLTQDHLNAGDHCRWCPAAGGCDEIHKHANEIAVRDFTDFDPPNAVDNVDRWTAIIEMGPAIKKYIETVHNEVLKAMKNGVDFPELKAIESMSNLKWIGDDEVVIKTLQGRKLPKKITTTEKLRTPTQLKKEGYEKKIADLCHRESNGLKVVLKTKKGEPVSFDYKEDFKEIEKKDV